MERNRKEPVREGSHSKRSTNRRRRHPPSPRPDHPIPNVNPFHNVPFPPTPAFAGMHPMANMGVHPGQYGVYPTPYFNQYHGDPYSNFVPMMHPAAAMNYPPHDAQFSFPNGNPSWGYADPAQAQNPWGNAPAIDLDAPTSDPGGPTHPSRDVSPASTLGSPLEGAPAFEPDVSVFDISTSTSSTSDPLGPPALASNASNWLDTPSSPSPSVPPSPTSSAAKKRRKKRRRATSPTPLDHVEPSPTDPTGPTDPSSPVRSPSPSTSASKRRKKSNRKKSSPEPERPPTDASTSAQSAPSGKAVKGFACASCKKTFPTEADIRKHMAVGHLSGMAPVSPRPDNPTRPSSVPPGNDGDRNSPDFVPGTPSEDQRVIDDDGFIVCRPHDERPRLPVDVVCDRIAAWAFWPWREVFEKLGVTMTVPTVCLQRPKGGGEAKYVPSYVSIGGLEYAGDSFLALLAVGVEVCARLYGVTLPTEQAGQLGADAAARRDTGEKDGGSEEGDGVEDDELNNVVLRAIYYKYRDIFANVGEVSNALYRLAAVTGTLRQDLGILGNTTATYTGSSLQWETVDGVVGVAPDKGWVTLPNYNLIAIIRVDGRIRWIIVTEKKAAAELLAKYLLRELLDIGPGIIISTEGRPDYEVRLVLPTLDKMLPPDVLILGAFDFDQGGLDIYNDLKYGTAAASLERSILVVERLKHIGLKHTDIHRVRQIDLTLPKDNTLKIAHQRVKSPSTPRETVEEWKYISDNARTFVLDSISGIGKWAYQIIKNLQNNPEPVPNPPPHREALPLRGKPLVSVGVLDEKLKSVFVVKGMREGISTLAVTVPDINETRLVQFQNDRVHLLGREVYMTVPDVNRDLAQSTTAYRFRRAMEYMRLILCQNRRPAVGGKAFKIHEGFMERARGFKFLMPGLKMDIAADALAFEDMLLHGPLPDMIARND